MNGKSMKRVIIVDDDAGMCEELKEALQQENLEITLANTAADALEQFRKTGFDLAILDVNLPGSTGIELARKLTEDHSETSIIVITGYASLDCCLEAWDAGAVSFIEKPLNPEELGSAVQEALERQAEERRRSRKVRRLEKSAMTDFRTGLYNHRYFNDRLAAEIRSARRHHYKFSVAIADIDFFKSVNDVYGHLGGDAVLRKFARLLEETVRKSDVLARYGGEEFLLLLNHTDKEGALAFAEHLRDSVDNRFFRVGEKKVKLTVSVGVSTFPEDGVTMKSLMDASDRALEKAKVAGGNRVSAGSISGESENKAGQKMKVAEADEMKEKLSDMVKRANRTVLESLRAFAREVNMRDHYSDSHLDEIASTAGMIADRLSLPAHEVENVKIAATLRDLGKAGVPDYILDKPGKLSEDERQLMEKHPRTGADIVQFIPGFRDVEPMVLYHHEMFGGGGYCTGLKGKQIPVGARIVSVADAYHALISDRPYRKAYTGKKAREIVRQDSGRRFDPAIIDAMEAVMRRG
jgi:diguanylate cyclase (GGDEF)-like protein